jgi:hypothetical protein
VLSGMLPVAPSSTMTRAVQKLRQALAAVHEEETAMGMWACLCYGTRSA